MKLLIVEDSRVVVERIWEILVEIPGLEIVGTAEDQRGALHLVAQSIPDVILLDLQIRGGSGLEILGAVKTDLPQIVVIVLTNHSSAPIREACLKAGADYFLDKSNDFGDLPKVLARVGDKSAVAPCKSAETGGAIGRKAAI